MIVVIGGSRHLSFIPDDVEDSLLSWTREEAHFILGDAKGTDATFQEYLKMINYSNVKIFHSGDAARHNLGNWETLNIDSGLKSKSHAMHTAKDREMTKIANTGLMIWDTRSPGTLSNVIDLLNQKKSCQVYVAGDDSNLYHLKALEDLEKWQISFPEVFDEAHARLKAHEKRVAKLNGRPDAAEPTLF